MNHKVEKSALQWAKLYLEYKILHAGSTDMLLQFVCDLNTRKIEATAKAFLEKRTELFKKHGSEKDGMYSVPEFLDDVLDTEDKPTKNPAHETFIKELTEIGDHKTTHDVDAIEVSLLKGQNPRELAQLFAQVGAELGVFNFHEIYTVTDKALLDAAQKG